MQSYLSLTTLEKNGAFLMWPVLVYHISLSEIQVEKVLL